MELLSSKKSVKPLERDKLVDAIAAHLTRLIRDTNGITLDDTLELACGSALIQTEGHVYREFVEFRHLLGAFQEDEETISTLLEHPVAHGLRQFFKRFPLPYREEHIHLTGSLTAGFIYPRLAKLLEGPDGAMYRDKLRGVYGAEADSLDSVEDLDRMLRLKEHERFDRYLEILLPAKLVLRTRQDHSDAAYHMASELYTRYNVGYIRLKFTLSRITQSVAQQVPGLDDLTPEDVVLGLYDGFARFMTEQSRFSFTLSPCVRKEPSFWDSSRFESKAEDFMHQVNLILDLKERYPELNACLTDVDTVGNERDLYRKHDFLQMQPGFRKLHQHGFHIRSHHGETWRTLRYGIQAVDNAMNIWHIDRLEHGLSLGINPPYYFHSIMQRVLDWNRQGRGVPDGCMEADELQDMDWKEHGAVLAKIMAGERLTEHEVKEFSRVKFFAALEVERYQHDVLNRMIHKGVSITSLPSSNQRLTTSLPDYKDHPFSWWERKSVRQGVGTDNYITLDTDYLQELVILLLSDPKNLKITKLLMVATGERRRPYLSKMLWDMD